jgi:hypothetical protein
MFLCTQAQFTDAYGCAGATTLLLLHSKMSLVLQFELILKISSIICAYGGSQKKYITGTALDRAGLGAALVIFYLFVCLGVVMWLSHQYVTRWKSCCIQ